MARAGHLSRTLRARASVGVFAATNRRFALRRLPRRLPEFDTGNRERRRPDAAAAKQIK